MPTYSELLVFLVRLKKCRQEVALAKHLFGPLNNTWDGYTTRLERVNLDPTPIARKTLNLQAHVSAEASRLQKVALVERVRETETLSRMHVFLCRSWKGNPVRSDWMGFVHWFALSELPEKEMLPERVELLSKIISGTKFRIKEVLGENGRPHEWEWEETTMI